MVKPPVRIKESLTYDPETGKYGFVIMNLIRLAGALTVVVLGASIFFSLRRERRQARGAR